MIGTVESIQSNMSMQNGMYVAHNLTRFFNSRLWIKVMTLENFLICLYKEAMFAMFSTHALREKWGIPVLYAYILRWRPLHDL